ncbi:GNAT family N-acetyltransferase [Geodermatophilus sp. SYSU D00691]
MTVRTGGVDDLPAVLGLLDGAVAWLVAQGRTGQWGDRPWSESAQRVERTRALIGAGELLLLDRDGAAVAALVHGPRAHDYVPRAEEDEDYVLLLVGDPTARGAGRRLLDEAWDRARARGVGRQRVDCYGGDDGKLVRFYESAGFTRTATFEVGGWPGQLLERQA